jgi:arylformamidase
MTTRIIDLTMTVKEGMQTFPTYWHPFVEITHLGRHGIENRETRKIVLGTHTGTHVDAPRHFIPGGMTVDEIPLNQLVGEASVLDLAHIRARQEVSVAELDKTLNGRPALRILLRFNWCKMLGTMAYYTEQPYLSEEAAQWLVDNGCKLLGMDVAMPDNPKNGPHGPKDSPNHKVLLENGVVLVEYLTNLGQVSQPTGHLVVAPLKILDSDGAPARCFIIEDQ